MSGSNALGDFIKARRTEKGLSLRELAAKSGVSHSYLNNLERGVDYSTGKPTNPTVEKLEKVARGLRVEPEVLFAIARGDAPPELSEITTAEPNRPPVTVPGVKTGRDLLIEALSDREKNAHLEFIEPGAVVMLPLYPVSCGEPIELDDHPDEHYPSFANITPGADAVMRVRGKSMLGLGYQEGDLLYVKLLHGRTPPSGSPVVATINGGATCKIFKTDDLGAYLESAPIDGEPWRRAVTAEVRLVAVVLKRMTNG